MNVLERALWTAAQTFLGVVTVSGLTALDATAGQMLLTAVIAAALSALKTLAQERLAVLETRRGAGGD